MFDPIQTPPEPPKIKYQIRISKFNFQNSIFKIQFFKKIQKSIFKNSNFHNSNIDPAMHNFVSLKS